MTFAATDAGGGETFSGSVSFKADVLTPDETIETADHKTAQDKHSQPRVKGQSGSTVVKTKLYSATLLSSLKANELGRIVVTAPTGFGPTIEGIITKVSPSYDIPSTLEFTIEHRIAVVYA